MKGFPQILVFLTLIGFSECINYPKLSVSLKNSGFHRELEYVVEFPKAIECDILIVQSLHQGIFVNNDQLTDLKRLNLIKSYVPIYSNVELPTESASPVTIYLYSEAKSTTRIRLPIHLRYHAPDFKSFKNIPLYEPSLYLGCNSSIYRNMISSEKYQFPCTNSTQIVKIDEFTNVVDACDWYDLKYLSDFHSSISIIAVPVGNLYMKIPVTLVTIMLAWAACAYIIFGILRHQQYINKKIQK